MCTCRTLHCSTVSTLNRSYRKAELSKLVIVVIALILQLDYELVALLDQLIVLCQVNSFATII